MSDLRLAALLDLDLLQKMTNAHYRAAGMPIGIIDAIDGSILVGAGWQDICLKFHRANPLTLQRCQESDNFIKTRLVEGEACHYKCKNGLWDIGIPIVVSGRHLATMFLGQFFYEGEVPDRTFFARLAGEFDFAVEEYLGALDRVPVFSREKVDYILEYDKALVTFIADLAEHSIMRVRSEAAVKQQAEFLQVLIDAMPCPVFYKDRRGLYLGCNRAFEQMLGVSREEITGKTVFEIAPRELAEVYEKADADVLAHPGTQTYETRIQSFDGRGYDVLLQNATFSEPEGEIGGVVGAFIDITDRKRADQERERLQEQLALAHKMESVGRLAGGVAHDFNNMLGVILGNVELALTNLDRAHPVYANLEGVREAAHHSADLTRQLLAFARKQTVAPLKLDLNETIGQMLPMLRRLIGENIELGWKPGPSLWQVRIDPAQVDQILMNLAANARDSITGVGRIGIQTENETIDDADLEEHGGLDRGEYVKLSISDDGCGMDREMLPDIFEPFFTTKQLGTGTGLGLATVYGIVKQNHGHISVYSEPGQGTTFDLYLPRDVAESSLDSPEATGAAEAAGTLAACGAETVLLVEDEAMLLKLTQNMLEKLGYRVLAANSPTHAIRIAREHRGKIHLLMTDVVMPEMNGRELAGEVLSLHPDLKPLFMSGYTSDVIARHGILEENIRFIQKPFTLKELAAAVEKALA